MLSDLMVSGRSKPQPLHPAPRCVDMLVLVGNFIAFQTVICLWGVVNG